METIMNIKKLLLLFFLFCFSSVSIIAQDAASALNIITQDALLKTDSYLASKKLNGRLPGSKGYELAAKYISEELSKLRLKPISKDGYFQKIKVEYNEILPNEHFSVIHNGKRTLYELGKDYVYRGFTGSGNFTAPVAFCGYGLSQPDLGYDDYAGIDVKGKVVLVYKFNPRWNIDGKVFTHGNPREKSIVAMDHGALGILFISFPNDKEPQKLIGSVFHGEGLQPQNFPQLHVSLDVADVLYKDSGFSLSQVQKEIDSSKKPFSFDLKSDVNISVKTKYTKDATTENVCGILEGSDPKLKDEFIIVGAHLDHVGEQAGKIYYPGANDNASGSSAVLQIARAISSMKIKPKRSICFSFFACEEQGLNGSTYFSKNLPGSKDKINAMLNFDCIAYGDSIQVYGGESFPDLWNTVKSIDENNKKLLVTRTGKGGGADAQPFFDEGIKTLYFVSTNSYAHLHQTTDTPETLNGKLFQDITQLGFLSVLKFANQ